MRLAITRSKKNPQRAPPSDLALELQQQNEHSPCLTNVIAAFTRIHWHNMLRNLQNHGRPPPLVVRVGVGVRIIADDVEKLRILVEVRKPRN